MQGLTPRDFFLSALANAPYNLIYMKTFTEHAAVNKGSQCYFPLVFPPSLFGIVLFISKH